MVEKIILAIAVMLISAWLVVAGFVVAEWFQKRKG